MIPGESRGRFEISIREAAFPASGPRRQRGGGRDRDPPIFEDLKQDHHSRKPAA